MRRWALRPLLLMIVLVGGAPVSLAQVASGVSAINRATVLDLLVFLAPGYLAVKLFQWVLTGIKRRAARANSLRFELVHVGTLIITLILSLVSASIAAGIVGYVWPEAQLFSYLQETPLINGTLFISLVIHTLVAMALAALAAIAFGLLDNWQGWMPVPVKKPWTTLWEDEYDNERHFVHVTFGKTAYIGKLGHVDSSGESRDLVLEDPHQYFDATGNLQQVGEFMLLRDVQSHQVRLIDLVSERIAIESQGGLEDMDNLESDEDVLAGDYDERRPNRDEKTYSRGSGGDA